MKNAGLKCDICGATKSQSGKPFTPAGLGAHKAHLHGSNSKHAEAGDAPASTAAEPSLLVCGICGVDHNARGVKFASEADIAQHQRRTHGISEKKPKKTVGKASKAEKSRKAPSLEANHVKFCPRCGFNMEIVNAAMALITES